MDATRREFMQKSGAALLGASAIGALAQPTGAQEADYDLESASQRSDRPKRPTMVVVYLRGGADPLNVIVPHGDPVYYNVRPTIAIPGQAQGDVPGVIKFNKLFGLNPSMAPLFPLFEQGVVVPIINVGSTHGTRSHFDAQDFMERAAPGVRTVTEGWLNRFMTATASQDDSDLRGIAVQPLLPRSLRGQYPVLAVPGYGSDMALSAFEELYGCEEAKAAQQREIALARLGDEGKRPKKSAYGDPMTEEQTRQTILATGTRAIQRIRKYRKITGGASSLGGNYPGSGFAAQLRDIATVIKAGVGLEVVSIDYSGWDHHYQQGGVYGTMSSMLADVSGSLRAFVDDLGQQRMNSTLVLLMSEFGRTVRENGTNGSDHGHGGFMLAIGGMLNGRKVYGKWSGLEAANLYQGRDMPVHTDFRMVFDEVLAKLYGFDSAKHDFFPEYRAAGKHLGLLKKVAAA